MRSAKVKLPGHPDKACDLVAEAIVDEYLKRDPESRLQIQVSGGRGALFVNGDVTSAADFDVSALVQRTLGAAGLLQPLEPFVALEQMPPDAAGLYLHGSGLPIMAIGYACDETREFLPKTVYLAKRIAKALEDKRQGDESWFWLGADGEVAVMAERSEPDAIFIQVEHGSEPLDSVRSKIEELAKGFAPGVRIKVNEFGPCEARGLAGLSGASGRDREVYGLPLPAIDVRVGCDIRHPGKAGAWLARAAAIGLVRSGKARAVLVNLKYSPGEIRPTSVSARDEKGRDISEYLDRSNLALDRVVKDWWRPGLNIDAIRWNLAGEAGLPWEA
jgi:S-adenosylmethionine synthetase